MSIVPLVKATIYGLLEDKEQVLTDMQHLGCLHLLPLKTDEGLRGEHGPTPQAREALKFLLSCPQRRRQMLDPTRFDPGAIEQQALELQHKINALEDERDFLQRRITNLKPWGEFVFPALDERHNLRLWFYIVPHNEMTKVEATNLVWEVVGRDERFNYVAVVSAEEPDGMPVARTHTGGKPLSQLEHRLEEVEMELEDLQGERAKLTRWCSLFARGLTRLEDQEERAWAAVQTYDQGPLFALQGWAPRETSTQLQRYADDKSLALTLDDPAPGDQPPTLLHNPQRLTVGEDLVTFYMTPGYRIWDPSIVVFLSFTLFFAMIFSDAGYAALLGAGLWFYWRQMGESAVGRRLRILFGSLIGATLIWGISAGSYFGIAPPPESLLGKLRFLDQNDIPTMMALSIFIGVAHLVLANVMDSWRRGFTAAALAPLGWVCMLLGGTALWIGPSASVVWQTAGTWAMGIGAVAVLLFTGEAGGLGQRLLSGMLGLTKITSAFGDVMSYLRLFALGLATGSLALAFNDLAAQVYGIPGLGMLLAILVLVIGHGINLVLAVVSGFVHGLRLNVIEFFNWGVTEEGQLFRVFARKESAPWSPGSSH